MKQWLKTYLGILPRWFGLPAALCAIILGGLLGGGITWQVGIALLVGAIIMMGGHTYNSWADYIYGLDRGTPASVTKWYTSGSLAIDSGLTTRTRTLIYWIVCYAVSAGLTAWISLSLSSPWLWLGWGIGVTTATIYSPGPCKGLKHLGFPEYCGIVGFGIGGCLLGYSATSGGVSFIPVVCGVAISLFWGLSWPVDQFPDAASDYQKGVRNLGTIIAVTQFPLSLYYLPAMLFSYVFQVFAISIGYLSPWTFLSILALPLFTLASVWIYHSQYRGETSSDSPDPKSFEKGVQFGLIGIFAAMILICVGEALG